MEATRHACHRAPNLLVNSTHPQGFKRPAMPAALHNAVLQDLDPFLNPKPLVCKAMLTPSWPAGWVLLMQCKFGFCHRPAALICAQNTTK